jgi:hypothetical protein
LKYTLFHKKNDDKKIFIIMSENLFEELQTILQTYENAFSSENMTKTQEIIKELKNKFNNLKFQEEETTKISHITKNFCGILQNKVTKLESEVSDLKKENIDLKKEIEILFRQHDDLTEQTKKTVESLKTMQSLMKTQ